MCDTHSEQINELAKALAAAQGELEPAEKNATAAIGEKGKLSRKYADLTAMIDAVRKVLPKHGLSIAQIVLPTEGVAHVRTMLMHESGQTVSCDRFEDRTTMEVVWCDSVTGKEISRRPMTAEERQHRLELVTPDKPADNGEGRAEVLALPAPPAANARTCLSCRHLSADGTEKAEPCMACAQANGGDTDNWEPRRECKTCAHVTSTVDGFPCGGCSLNPDPGHGGDEDRWTWKDAPKEGMPC